MLDRNMVTELLRRIPFYADKALGEVGQTIGSEAWIPRPAGLADRRP